MTSAKMRQERMEIFKILCLAKGCTCLGDVYVNSTTKIAVRCDKCGREWDAHPWRFSLGRGCEVCNQPAGPRVKLTLDAFRDRCSEVGMNCLSDTYVNGRSQVQVECKKCGLVESKPAKYILGGNGCRKCSDAVGGWKRRVVNNPKKLQKLIDIIDARGGSLISSNYDTRPATFLVSCGRVGHPAWSPNLLTLKAGIWCLHCWREKNHLPPMVADVAQDLALAG